MKHLFFVVLLLLSYLVQSQKRSCEKGVCLYEDSLFYLKEYYRGQFIRFHYYEENTTNELKGTSGGGHKLALVLKDGSLQYFPQPKPTFRPHSHRPRSNKKEYITLHPHRRTGSHFDAHNAGFKNDSVLEYVQYYGKKNSLLLLRPGKYVATMQRYLAPDDQLVTLQKKFEIREVPDSLKQPFLDFLLCINYCMPIEKRDSNIEKYFDPLQPTIVWYFNKYPYGLYTAELFHFISNWRSNDVGLSLEGQAKIYKQLLELVPKVGGNRGLILEDAGKYAHNTDLMYRYRLIEDEKDFMDQLLKKLEDLPAPLSEVCIRNYQYRHPDQTLINYAQRKHDKK